MKLLALICACIYLVQSSTAKNELTVSLFYESYCPDCEQYMKEQVLPVWIKLKGHFSLDLLPFGNAQQRFVDGHWEFNCQHELEECVANKLHACAIYQLCGDSGTVSCEAAKVTQVLKYITCVEAHDNQAAASDQCAKKVSLDANKISECAKGDEGDHLLNFYGNRTLGFVPRLRQVPTIAINGKPNYDAVDNLLHEICRLRPQICKHIDFEVDLP